MSGLSKTTRVVSREAALAERGWVIIDAAGKVVGRLATEIAGLLRGKGKPSFSPSVDGGDFVIVVNAAKMRLTGNKARQKMYYSHSGYPGSIKAVSAEAMMTRHPDRVLRMAVEGMLPRNRLGRKLVTKLKIYAGAEHPHAAQKPRPLGL